jgi:hypothetical protein
MQFDEPLQFLIRVMRDSQALVATTFKRTEKIPRCMADKTGLGIKELLGERRLPKGELLHTANSRHC